MNHHYTDIRDRIAGPPKWWDENAVPRYCEFGPRETANIYATEVALLEIACQGCGQRFKVCMASSLTSRISSGALLGSLSELVEAREIHYGDPPNVGCCPAGPTMNSVPLRVIEFWVTTTSLEWRREEQFEVEVMPEWAT